MLATFNFSFGTFAASSAILVRLSNLMCAAAWRTQPGNLNVSYRSPQSTCQLLNLSFMATRSLLPLPLIFYLAPPGPFTPAFPTRSLYESLYNDTNMLIVDVIFSN